MFGFDEEGVVFCVVSPTPASATWREEEGAIPFLGAVLNLVHLKLSFVFHEAR